MSQIHDVGRRPMADGEGGSASIDGRFYLAARAGMAIRLLLHVTGALPHLPWAIQWLLGQG